MSQDRTASASMHSPDIEVIIPRKPRRPLTCYGIFSILERNFFWQEGTKYSTNDRCDSTSDDPYAATRPQRYRSLVLPSNWFKVGMNRKKRGEHVKHGMISFEEMTKAIAERWKSADVETKVYCEVIANDELERYKTELNAYKETYGEDAVKSKTKTQVKHQRKRTAVEGCSSRKNTDPFHANRYFTDHCKSYQRGDRNACNGTYTAENRTEAMKSQFREEQLSDYLPDDVTEALALVGNDYDNILPGEELDKTFDSDEE